MAKERQSLSLFSNIMLIHLGLIKSEDKHFKPTVDLMGPFIMLEHAIRQPYFPRQTKEVLQIFLQRPAKRVDATGSVKHKLLQTLYQY